MLADQWMEMIQKTINPSLKIHALLECDDSGSEKEWSICFFKVTPQQVIDLCKVVGIISLPPPPTEVVIPPASFFERIEEIAAEVQVDVYPGYMKLLIHPCETDRVFMIDIPAKTPREIPGYQWTVDSQTSLYDVVKRAANYAPKDYVSQITTNDRP